MYSAVEIWGPHLCTGACNPPAEISGGHTVGSREGYVSVLALVFSIFENQCKNNFLRKAYRHKPNT